MMKLSKHQWCSQLLIFSFIPLSLSSVLCDILFKPWPAIGLLKWHQRLYAIKMSIIHILTGKHYCSWSKSWLMLQVPNKWALTHTNTRESHTHTHTQTHTHIHNTCTHTHTHTHTQWQRHTHTHTHTLPEAHTGQPQPSSHSHPC